MTAPPAGADDRRRDAVLCAVADLLGASRLAADATAALAGVVEHAHRDVRHGPARRDGAGPARVGGVAGLVYGGVRGVAALVGRALAAASPGAPGRDAVDAVPNVDAGVASGGSAAGAYAAAAAREAVLAALNGVVGDHLARTGNPLAVRPALRVGPGARGDGRPPPNGRVVVLVHGLCMGPRGWQRRGHDHGAALARDLGLAPVYLHYNTGRHVSENGRDFAAALEALLGRWPVPVDEITVVAHSMGGLVARSACHYGAALGHAWPGALRRLVFLGTPHHGAPLERAGHRASSALGAVPYAAAYARIGRLRSAGVTDLRHGNLLDEDWAAGDRFGVGADGRRPLPLPAGLECHAFAAALGARGGPADAVIGDGLVPVASALGEHPDARFDLAVPDARRWLGRGMHHFELLDRPEVYAALRERIRGR